MIKIKVGNDIYRINLRRLWKISKEFLAVTLFLISSYIMLCILFSL